MFSDKKNLQMPQNILKIFPTLCIFSMHSATSLGGKRRNLTDGAIQRKFFHCLLLPPFRSRCWQFNVPLRNMSRYKISDVWILGDGCDDNWWLWWRWKWWWVMMRKIRTAMKTMMDWRRLASLPRKATFSLLVQFLAILNLKSPS